MKNVLITFIKIYQKSNLFNNPVSRMFFGSNVCRFTPTCSEYSIEAVQKYGALKGSFMGIKRFLRCHPFAKGGYDPVK